MRRLLFAAALAIGACTAAHGAPVDAPPPGDPIVIGRSYILHSQILGDDRRINVYLPPHYGEAGRRVPVVVLLDGGAAEDFHHISGLAQITAANGDGQELMVVGVEGVDRRHDLTSPSPVAADRRLLPTGGGAKAYRRFLVEELRPWIAARYPFAGRTALMGESLAGLFTVETLLQAPASFDDYVAVSPSLWWSAGALSREARTDFARPGLAGRRAFIAFDDPPRGAPPGDSPEQARLARALETAPADALQWRLTRPGEGHSSIYHPAALAAFRWLYGTPSRAPRN